MARVLGWLLLALNVDARLRSASPLLGNAIEARVVIGANEHPENATATELRHVIREIQGQFSNPMWRSQVFKDFLSKFGANPEVLLPKVAVSNKVKPFPPTTTPMAPPGPAPAPAPAPGPAPGPGTVSAPSAASMAVALHNLAQPKPAATRSPPRSAGFHMELDPGAYKVQPLSVMEEKLHVVGDAECAGGSCAKLVNGAVVVVPEN